MKVVLGCLAMQNQLTLLFFKLADALPTLIVSQYSASPFMHRQGFTYSPTPPEAGLFGNFASGRPKAGSEANPPDRGLKHFLREAKPPAKNASEGGFLRK